MQNSPDLNWRVYASRAKVVLTSACVLVYIAMMHHSPGAVLLDQSTWAAQVDRGPAEEAPFPISP